ncbi:MAG: fibronectin type III domain-containing protein [Oscillospiraceae bacterium]|nr:fibronectin type III domain-containing protein [Oscillospiraceae bacterium]
MKKKILSVFLTLAMAAGVVLVPNGGLIFKSSAESSDDYEYVNKYITLSKRDYSWDYLPELHVNTDLSENSATLTWKAVPDAVQYDILRYNSTKKEYAIIATKKGNATSHKITGLKPGTFYTFRVRAQTSYEGNRYISNLSDISVRTLDDPSKIKSRNDKIDKGYTAGVTSKTVKISAKNIYTTADTRSNWARVSSLTQFVDKGGNPCFAYEDGDYIKIAKLDKNQKLTSTLKIKKKYPLFGGLTSDAKGNYYIVWGQDDEKEKKTVVTLAVSKYNGDGKHIKTTTYQGGDIGTKLPFYYGVTGMTPYRCGNCAIALKGDVLVVNYARTMYKSSDGLNHQSNGVIAVNISSMEKNQDYGSYASHSFDQRVMFDKTGAVWFAQHGDAYPRGFKAETEGKAFVPFHFYLDASDFSDMYIVNITNAQLGGIVETSTGIVLAGASVKGMTKSTYEKQSRNLFVVYADPELKMPGGKSRTGDCNGAKVTDTGILWLTDYGTDYEARESQVVYTNNDRIVVMWEKHNRKTGKFAQSYYMVLSSNGAVLQKAAPMNKIRLNACEEPVYANGRIYWVTAEYGGNAKIHELKIGELVPKKK